MCLDKKKKKHKNLVSQKKKKVIQKYFLVFIDQTYKVHQTESQKTIMILFPY